MGKKEKEKIQMLSGMLKWYKLSGINPEEPSML